MGFCSVERFWIKLYFDKYLSVKISLRKGDMEERNCVIPVVCVTNEREESVVNQHN